MAVAAHPQSPTSITRLTRLGAAAIAFDVVFAEPDRLSPALAADAYRDLDEETRNKLRASARATTRSWPRPCGGRGSCLAKPACRLPVRKPTSQPPTAGVAALGGDPKPFLFSFPGLLRNIPILEKAAAGRGLFSIRTERDGIVRRVPMVVQCARQHHAVAVASRCFGWSTGAQARF